MNKNKHKTTIAAAAFVVFVLPQIVLWPFRGQIRQMVPEPPLWAAMTMLLGLIIIFALTVALAVQTQTLPSRPRRLTE